MIDVFYFYIPIIIFWTIHTIRRDLFWIYFWEKRGSRFNRFFNSLKENKGILISKSAIFSLFLILSSFLITKIDNLFEIIILAFYLILGAYSLYLLLNSIYLKDFKSYFFVIPKLTKRIILLFVFIIFLEALFLGVITIQALKTFNNLNLFLYLLIFEAIFPFFFIFAILIFNFFLFFLDKISEIKAKKKMSELKDLIVIGVSGSYGKTITKDFLYKIISEKYKVLKTEGEEANKEDIVKLINTKLNKTYDVFICEISAFKAGEVKKICNILNPKIGIITGISESRISLFGNLKNIINTKYELVNCLPEEGVGIFNIGDKECQKLYQRPKIKKYSYSSAEEKGDVFSKNILISEKFIEFDLVSWKAKERMKLNFSNFQYLESFIGAATCALILGLDNSQIKKATNKIKIFGNFMVNKKGENGIQIIDDTSNKKPDGFFDAINYIKKYKGKKIIVASSLLELGKSAFAVHNNIGKKIGEVCDIAIITNPLFLREIKLGAVSVGMDSKKIIFLKHPGKILKSLKPYFKKENVILLEGEISDKIKEYLIVDDKKS